MSDTAFQVQYRQQVVDGFEQRKSLLMDACTNEAEIKGNQAVFLTADSGAAVATTRGVNGLIPARADNLTQNTCTLVEWHDLVRKTRFNIFASQGNQTQVMQKTTMAVINRKIDADIIGELDGAVTNHAGATAVTASLALVMRGLTILGNNKVPLDGNVNGLISPAFYAYLMQIKEFTNVQYTSQKIDQNSDAWKDQLNTFRWAGVYWMVHPGLTGAGTASEQCYMFHKSAIGHAVDTGGIQSPVGYMEEQDYSWARCSVFMGTKMLQTAGVVQILHDGSAYVAT